MTPRFRRSAACSANFPNRRIEIVIVRTDAPNAKAGVLEELAKRARYPLLLVNDSDIVVEPGYLRAVTAPLADPEVGMVTCLYRAAAQSWPSRSEALGIATEFAPSVMVARLLGVAEFALGSTMVFRTGGSGADRRLRGDRQLPGRRLPVGPADRAVGLPYRVRACGGGNGSGRGKLGEHVASPVALVADDPRVAPFGLLRVRGDTRHALVAGRAGRGPVAGGGRRDDRPYGGGRVDRRRDPGGPQGATRLLDDSRCAISSASRCGWAASSATPSSGATAN